MSPTLYHTFKGFVKVLSSYHINPIDVRKVIDIKYKKRLFCIIDREYKYNLEMEYLNPRSEISPVALITFSGNLGIGFYNEHIETSVMTLTYKTEKEVIDEINEIKKKKELISQFDNEQNLKLEEFVKNCEKL